MPLKIAPLCLLLLVPLSARAAPPEADSRLTVLESVRVGEHHDPRHGHGLKLSFQPLRPNQALARFSLEEARMVVSTLEAEFKARSRPSSIPALVEGQEAPCFILNVLRVIQ
jgi:hypothetical protein